MRESSAVGCHPLCPVIKLDPEHLIQNRLNKVTVARDRERLGLSVQLNKMAGRRRLPSAVSPHPIQSLLRQTMKLIRQSGYDVIQVSHQPVVSGFENGRVLVLINRRDDPGAANAHGVLDLAGYSDR